MTNEQDRENRKTPGVWQTVFSVLAAFFGVQSEKNRQRDFTHGNPLVFIVVGLVLTVMLVVGLFIAVQIIISQAGP